MSEIDVKATQHSTPAPPDPRPRLLLGPPVAVAGVRCSRCSFPSLEDLERCPVCGADALQTSFGSLGTVFAATIFRIPVGNHPGPIALAYVDLDDGPRLLAHGDDTGEALRPGEQVVVTGLGPQGDPVVRRARDVRSIA